MLSYVITSPFVAPRAYSSVPLNQAVCPMFLLRSRKFGFLVLQVCGIHFSEKFQLCPCSKEILIYCSLSRFRLSQNQKETNVNKASSVNDRYVYLCMCITLLMAGVSL